VYEKRTGFYGIGRMMIEFEVWQVVSPDDLRKETVCGKN
jgi:hypothetical protein